MWADAERRFSRAAHSPHWSGLVRGPLAGFGNVYGSFSLYVFLPPFALNLFRFYQQLGCSSSPSRSLSSCTLQQFSKISFAFSSPLAPLVPVSHYSLYVEYMYGQRHGVIARPAPVSLVTLVTTPSPRAFALPSGLRTHLGTRTTLELATWTNLIHYNGHVCFFNGDW